MNPQGCAAAISRILVEEGLPDVAIGIVTGDDLLPRLDELSRAGETFAHFETGESIDSVRSRIVSANAYLGAAGIVEALAGGARIVITGRVADASLTVGPAVHEFGWSFREWERLAATTVAGHLIECGGQCTGGMYSAWTPDIRLADIGYPISRDFRDSRRHDHQARSHGRPCRRRDSLRATTVRNRRSGSLSDARYRYRFYSGEVGASRPRSRERSRRRRQRGAGKAESLGRLSGRILGLLDVDGLRSARGRDRPLGRRDDSGKTADGRRHARADQRRSTRRGRHSAERLPGERAQPWDVVLRISAADPSRAVLDRFTCEFAPLVTAGQPGVTGYIGGRAKPRPVLAYWPTTVSRERVQPRSLVRPAQEWSV